MRRLALSGLDAAIVDLDGTMVDTMNDFVVALNLMLQDLRWPTVERTVVERLVGKGSEHLVRSVLIHLHGAQTDTTLAIEALYPKAWASFQHHYREVNGHHSEVYAGVVEGLAHLKGRGLKLACLTNKRVAFADQLLTAKGLKPYFVHTFGGDSFERKKPDPLPLLKTCEILGTSPSRTLMVGDSSNDARAARAAGCPVVLVTYGYNHGVRVQSEEADGYVDSLAQLGTE